VKVGFLAGDGRTIRTGLLSAISRVASLGLDALREIFDESAYRRFLDRSRLESSATAYAIFQQENEQAKSSRPRCC
jgi:hypothetical protein